MEREREEAEEGGREAAVREGGVNQTSPGRLVGGVLCHPVPYATERWKYSIVSWSDACNTM